MFLFYGKPKIAREFANFADAKLSIFDEFSIISWFHKFFFETAELVFRTNFIVLFENANFLSFYRFTIL